MLYQKNKRGLIKIIILSILASNIGYTLFLMPVLGTIYPNKVPLTLINILSFALIDSLFGIMLGISIFLLLKKKKYNAARSAGLSIVFLWLLYWLPMIGNLKLEIFLLDGIAALLTWSVFILFHKRIIR